MALGRAAQRSVCSVPRPKAFPSWKAGTGAGQGQAGVGGGLVALKSRHPQARPTLCTSQRSRLGLGLAGLQPAHNPAAGQGHSPPRDLQNSSAGAMPAPLGHRDSPSKKRANRPEETGGKTNRVAADTEDRVAAEAPVTAQPPPPRAGPEGRWAQLGHPCKACFGKGTEGMVKPTGQKRESK